MAKFKHFPITFSTFTLRIIHVTHLKRMMYSYFHVQFTILLTLTEHFSCLHDRNLQYSSALLHRLVNTNDMCIMPSKIAQNIVSRCSTKLATVNVGKTKEPPSLYVFSRTKV